MSILNEHELNVIDPTPLINFYDSIGVYRTDTMKKADPSGVMHLIDPILRKRFPLIDQFVGGNFYKHTKPYLPHTDHQLSWGKPSVNIVLPLWFEGTLPTLLVFDQIWKNNSVTWTMGFPKAEGKISSSTNTQITGFPHQYDIEGKTGSKIDEQFHRDYLQLPRSWYDDLSGQAFPFVPGSAIMFDNSKIHCTGKFTGEKLGLSLRYTVNN